MVSIATGEIVAGRPLEGEGVGRRVWPFAIAGALPLAFAIFIADVNVATFLCGAGMVPLIVAAGLYLPWARFPAWTQALPPLIAFAAVALIRDATGGADSPLTPLVIVPVLWMAIYGTRREVSVALVALAITLAGPIAVLGEPEYPSTALVDVGVWIVVASIVGVAINSLVNGGREAEMRFRRAFDGSRVAMALVSRGGEYMRVNPAFTEITGYSSEELIGRRFTEITHPDDVDEDLAAQRELAAGTRESYRAEKRYVRANGSEISVELTVSAVHDESGRVTHMVAHVEDIGERKAVEATLTRQAMHDPLTSLPNRILFADRVRVARARRRTDSDFAVIFVDLDDFKKVNDSLGHAAGDEVLIEVASRLSKRLREGDTLARLGGDEFAILCEGIDEEVAEEISERVLASFSEPVSAQGRDVHQGASVGLALGRSSASDADPERIIRDADMAMYKAKAAGGDRRVVFESAMRWRSAPGTDPQGELEHAITHGELRLHYQPQVEIARMSVPSVEALLRWEHPTRGMLVPNDFLYLAENTDLIVQIDDWVLEEACAEAARWRRRSRNGDPIGVSINLSSEQLADPELASRIDRVMVASRLPPSAICLEIHVRSVTDRDRSALRALPGLERLGIALAIDDFGALGSSLTTITRLPGASELKIDASYIAGLGHSQRDAAAVAAIVGAGHGAGLTVTAEGVETEEQLSLLRDLGCDRAQGFLLARPVPANRIGELLDASGGNRRRENALLG